MLKMNRCCSWSDIGFITALVAAVVKRNCGVDGP